MSELISQLGPEIIALLIYIGAVGTQVVLGYLPQAKKGEPFEIRKVISTAVLGIFGAFPAIILYVNTNLPEDGGGFLSFYLIGITMSTTLIYGARKGLALGKKNGKNINIIYNRVYHPTFLFLFFY